MIHEIKYQINGSLKNLTLLSEPNLNDNYFTILIGPNGTFKSSLLGSIADYHLGKQTKEMVSVTELTVSYLDKIIAVSPSPFDKFPSHVGNFTKLLKMDVAKLKKNAEKNSYSYLGFKSLGGHGLRNKQDRVYSTLLNAISLGGNEAVARSIIDCLRFLNIEPAINLKWSFAKLEDSAKKKKAKSPVDEFFYKNFLKKHSMNDKPTSTHYRKFSLSKIVDEDVDFLVDLYNLDKSGFVEIDNILVKQISNSRQYDLLNSSSGEINIFLTLLGLCAAIRDHSVILIDEPEISLHPNWQTEYVNLLSEICKGYRNCHFVIATHSPYIVSNMPAHNVNIVKVRKTGADEIEFSDFKKNAAGWSVERILLEVFDMQTAGNTVFEEKVQDLLSLISNPKIEDRVNKLKVGIEYFKDFDLMPDDPLLEYIKAAEDIAGND